MQKQKWKKRIFKDAELPPTVWDRNDGPNVTPSAANVTVICMKTHRIAVLSQGS